MFWFYRKLWNMCLLITVLMDPFLLKSYWIAWNHYTNLRNNITYNSFSFLIFNILETIAFSATWISSAHINKGTVLRFNNVQLNEGDGWVLHRDCYI